jgi:hypothetical protein
MPACLSLLLQKVVAYTSAALVAWFDHVLRGADLAPYLATVAYDPFYQVKQDGVATFYWGRI